MTEQDVVAEVNRKWKTQIKSEVETDLSCVLLKRSQTGSRNTREEEVKTRQLGI